MSQADTRQGDVVYHVARRLNWHVGAVRERLLAFQLFSGEAKPGDWAASVPPDPPRPKSKPILHRKG